MPHDERPGAAPISVAPPPPAERSPGEGLSHTKRTSVRAGVPSTFDGLPTVSREYYSVEGEVGRGGQGRVLRAKDRRLLRTVALKESLHDDPASLARFTREAFITARLEHPSIVPVHEAGRWVTGEPFYVMKSVSGRALDALIAEATSFEGRMKLLPNVARVAEALAYAHSRRIIHRDLKPSNVLVGEFGETVVIDWGLAKELGGPSLAEPVRDASIDEVPPSATIAGDIVGTPAYMPPEQARGDSVDERADVYALGAMLYHLIAGSAPFALRKGLARSVLRGPPDPLEHLEPRVPRDLLAAIDKAMSRDSEKRYANAGELASELQTFLAGRLVAAHRYSAWQLVRRWVSRHRAVLTATGLLATLLVALGIASIARIVHERDLANRARAATEAAERQATDRSHELVLLQARAQLDRDPTASLAWLKTYPPSAPNWKTVSETASDAAARGVARHVWHGELPFASVTFSPDSRHVVAGSRERGLRLWDVDTGALHQLESDVPLGGPVVFSPDGRWIASSDGLKALRIWEVATGARRAFDAIDAGRLEFSSDSELLLVAGSLGGGVVVTVATGSRAPLARGPKPIVSSSFLPGEHEIAAVDADSVMIIDAATGDRTLVGPLRAKPSSVAVSPDKRWIVVGTPERSIVVFDRETGKRRELFSKMFLTSRLRFSGSGALVSWGTVTGGLLWDLQLGQSHDVNFPDICQTLDFLPGGTLLVSGQQSGLTRWDPDADRGRPLLGHATTVAALAVSPDGRWAATAAADRTVRLWQLGNERVLRKVFGGPLSPDGRTILGMTPNEYIAETVDVATGKVKAIGGPRTWVWGRSGAFAPDGRSVLISGGDHDFVVVDLASDVHRRVLRYEEATALDLAEEFSPDGRSAAVAMNTGNIDLLDLIGGSRRTLGKHEGKALAVSVAPDGKTVASGGRDNALRLWNVIAGQQRVLLGHGGAILGLAYSPDGTRIASGSEDGTVRVWNVTTGESQVLEGHAAQVYSVAFDPSGSIVLSGSADRTVRLWNLSTGESRIVWWAAGAVEAVRFFPDGKRVMASTDDATVSVWEPDVAGAFETDPTKVRAWLDAQTLATVDANGAVSTLSPR